MARLRPHLSYANVVSTLCLSIVLGGTAYAATSLTKGSVLSRHILNGQVKSVDLAVGAVTTSRVRDGSLRARDFAAGQLPPGPKGDTGATGATGPTGPSGATGPAGTVPASEAYREVGAAGQPAFQNSWTNEGFGESTAGFYLDALGEVHLKGNVVGGGLTTVFTLPAAYRPSKIMCFAAWRGGQGVGADAAAVCVYATGAVLQLAGPTVDGLTLDGITFRAGAG